MLSYLAELNYSRSLSALLTQIQKTSALAFVFLLKHQFTCHLNECCYYSCRSKSTRVTTTTWPAHCPTSKWIGKQNEITLVLKTSFCSVHQFCNFVHLSVIFFLFDILKINCNLWVSLYDCCWWLDANNSNKSSYGLHAWLLLHVHDVCPTVTGSGTIGTLLAFLIDDQRWTSAGALDLVGARGTVPVRQVATQRWI
jgi:hypothetical protein